MRRRLSVTTAAATSRLTTIAAATAAIAGSPDPADVQRWIDAASAAIARHTGRVLARESVTETFWPDGRYLDALRLDRVPVSTLTSVTVDGTALTLATDVVLDADSGLLQRLSSDIPVEWYAGKITAVYAGGWLLPGTTGANLPADIERACLITVTAMAAGTGRDPQLRSESADGIGASSWLDPRAEDGALPWSAAALLAPWRRYAIA
jgi:hypothetical protein